MRGDEDLAVTTEAAWVRFRRWLADRLAGLEVRGSVRVDVVTGVGEDELNGRPPSLEFDMFVDGEISVETAADDDLDPRFRYGHHGVRLLADAGWLSADGDDEAPHLEVSSDEVDRLALLGVQVLREVYGVPHPALLLADGLEAEFPAAPTEVVPPPWLGPDDELPCAFVHSSEELHALVDRALRPLVGDEIHHDDDGDVPMTVERSTVFVRVLEGQPTVELFAHIVTGVTDLDRLAGELNRLNRSHGDATFYVVDDRVVMRRRLPAAPFIPRQLRSVLTQTLDEVDGLARDLAERVGGLRFLDHLERVPEEVGDPAFDLLLELLHDDAELPGREVAVVFGHDRDALHAAIDRLRLESAECDGLAPALVLACLRRGLRQVVAAAADDSRRPLPPRPRHHVELGS